MKMDEATELGNQEDINRFSKRTVKVTPQHNDECKELLRVMGIPYVEAPCEAEAQCAELAKSGKVFAAASEDMDTLTFGTPVLLRHLTFSEARKMPIDEVNLEKALEGLELTMAEVSFTCWLKQKEFRGSHVRCQFIDLCILMGCDYTETIKGVGPKNAYNLIKQHKTIDEAIKHLTPRLQDNIPAEWNYADARRLFVESEVTPGKDIEVSYSAVDGNMAP